MTAIMRVGPGTIVMKHPHRRQFLHLAAGAATLPVVPRVATAQAYPSRLVRLIAGFPAGGTVDVFARLAAQRLSERLGQAFIVENRVGASGNLAAEAVVRAAADGYTLLMINAGNAINTTLYQNLSFNFIRDIAPVASICQGPGVMLVAPTFPAKSVAEFIAHGKVNPGKINMGAPTGTPPHIYGELFKMMAGVDIVHIPYRGGVQALADLLGGQVHVVFDTVANSLEHIKAGRLRALGVTSATR